MSGPLPLSLCQVSQGGGLLFYPPTAGVILRSGPPPSTTPTAPRSHTANFAPQGLVFAGCKLVGHRNSLLSKVCQVHSTGFIITHHCTYVNIMATLFLCLHQEKRPITVPELFSPTFRHGLLNFAGNAASPKPNLPKPSVFQERCSPITRTVEPTSTTSPLFCWPRF